MTQNILKIVIIKSPFTATSDYNIGYTILNNNKTWKAFRLSETNDRTT